MVLRTFRFAGPSPAKQTGEHRAPRQSATAIWRMPMTWIAFLVARRPYRTCVYTMIHLRRYALKLALYRRHCPTDTCPSIAKARRLDDGSIDAECSNGERFRVTPPQGGRGPSKRKVVRPLLSRATSSRPPMCGDCCRSDQI